MRISDWSSDVCSSYLYQGLRVYPDTQIYGLKRRFRGGGCTWHISDPLRRSYHRRYTTCIWFSNARLQPDSWFGESQSRRPTKTNGEAPEHRLLEAPKVGRGVCLLATRKLPYIHVPHFRSEEHTSELQSLMRNSYAVFCL